MMSGFTSALVLSWRRGTLYLVRRWATRLTLYAILVAWGCITLYPFLWILLTSFKSRWEPYHNPFGLPERWLLENYPYAWRTARTGQLANNSFFVAVTSTLIAMSLAATCAFALSRFRFAGRGLIFSYIIAGLLIPGSTRLVPLVIFTRQLGLYDKLLGLALIYAVGAIPFNVFFLVPFMQTIPREMEEAAIMDGATMWQVFLRIIVPLSQPALVTMATFHMLFCWNEYITALLLTASPKNWTMPVGMEALMQRFGSNYTAFAAAMVLSFIPAILFFIALQRYVVKGMAAGALQGL